jgi:hypothetical protein
MLSHAEHAAAYERDAAAATPQARAGLERSRRMAAKRHHRDWGILAPVVERKQIEQSIEQRIERKNQALRSGHRKRRADEAARWRRARQRLRELPRARALELLEQWNHGSEWAPSDATALLTFLDSHAPTAERIEHLRRTRRESAEIHRSVARQLESWYIEHVGCPEGELGTADRSDFGRRVLRCILCQTEWTRGDLPAAEATGELRIVDCQRAEQAVLL